MEQVPAVPVEILEHRHRPVRLPPRLFEEALAQLERIVAELESGQAPLERSIEMYERGARLKAHCEAKLKAAQLRVEKIVVGANGPERVEPAEFT